MKMNMKKFKFNKSIGLIVIVGVLFAAAVYLNVTVNDGVNVSAAAKPTPTAANDAKSVSTGVSENYFSAYRDERDGVRDKEIAYLDTIIYHEATDAETLKDAQDQKLALVTNMELEFTLESLIKSKGFEDVAVTYHPGSVNVIVDCEKLTSEGVARILDVILTETGESAKNVKVSNY